LNTRKNGYIKVSRKDQNENHQLEAMKQHITDERDILSTNKAEGILIVINTNSSKFMNFLNNTSYLHNIIPPIELPPLSLRLEEEDS
jgi:hypothetical protein